MVSKKNPALDYKRKREIERKAIEKAAKVAALSAREATKRKREKEQREEIRGARLEREKTELLDRQAEYKMQRKEEVAQSRREAEKSAARVLKDVQEEEAASRSAPKTTSARKAHAIKQTKQLPSPASIIHPTTPPSPSVVGPTAPTLKQICEDAAYDVTSMPVPDRETVTSLATMRVLCSDATNGIGMWGEGSGKWAKPVGWWPLIEDLNKAFNHYGQTDKKIVMGEYNAVFIDNIETYSEWLPPLVDASGKSLELSELVFRITRPDVDHDGTEGAPCRHRYKTLSEQADEMYYSLHGAANGYAIPCVAAIIFSGPRVRRKGKSLQLYGSLYILKKAPVTLSNVLDDHKMHLFVTKKLPLNSPELQTAFSKGARKVCLRVLPVLVKQARLGGLYFDCKPANTLFVDGTSVNVYLSDFDAAMYSILRINNTNWEAHLLVSLLLMGAHIRCHQPLGVADGWAGALHSLILELAVAARGAGWLFQARIHQCDFIPGRVATTEDAMLRLEMMVFAYFCDEARVCYFKCNPRFNTTVDGKSLVNQMVKFVLTGSPVSRDAQVCKVLGE